MKAFYTPWKGQLVAMTIINSKNKIVDRKILLLLKNGDVLLPPNPERN